MKLLKHPLFLGSALLTTAHGVAERMKFNIPYISSYLDDLACFPVVLTLGLAFLRRITGSPNYILSREQVILAVVYFSVMFEGVLPGISENYTRDPLDIIAYSAGAFLFAKYINRKPMMKHKAAGS